MLDIAHGGDIHPPWSGVKTRSCAPSVIQLHWPEIAPMDKKFQKPLLPLLREGWPGLQGIETRGVSRKVLGDLEDMEGVRIEVDKGLSHVGMRLLRKIDDSPKIFVNMSARASQRSISTLGETPKDGPKVEGTGSNARKLTLQIVSPCT